MSIKPLTDMELAHVKGQLEATLRHNKALSASKDALSQPEGAK